MDIEITLLFKISFCLLSDSIKDYDFSFIYDEIKTHREIPSKILHC